MRIVFKIAHIVVGILLAVSTAFQLLALFGGVLLNENNNFTENTPWLVPVWGVTLALLIVAYVLLLKLGDRHPWPPILFVAALVGAVAAFVVAITLRDALPDHLNASGQAQGITTWKLLYRHLSSVLVGVLIAVESAAKWMLCRRERQKAQAVAADAVTSTIGLDSFARDDGVGKKPKKLKRSMRRAKEKTQDSNAAVE